jgi:hypothetical protein
VDEVAPSSRAPPFYGPTSRADDKDNEYENTEALSKIDRSSFELMRQFPGQMISGEPLQADVSTD